jgi:DNA-binding MarR family transcriptional regulator
MDPAPPSDLAELTAEFMRHGRMLHRMKMRLSTSLPEGLDWAAVVLLMQLKHCGPTRQVELADRVVLDPSTVSRYVAQLVRRGLVERRPDPEDGRAVRLAATDVGQELSDRIKQDRDTHLHRVLDHWEPRDLRDLTALLRRFNDDMESFHEAAVIDDEALGAGSKRRPTHTDPEP